MHNIYQLHPVHGKHIAHLSLEAQNNEKNGWRTVNEVEFYRHDKKPEPAFEVSKHDDFEQRYESALGKKPDKRKKRETLEAELTHDSAA